MSKKKQDVLTVSDMAEEFPQEVMRVQLDRAIAERDIAMFKVKQLEETVASLRSAQFNAITPEEIILAEQISILQKVSKGREMTLDEVKKLDILIKNHRLVKNQSTENTNAEFRDVSEADLVAIATKKDN